MGPVGNPSMGPYSDLWYYGVYGITMDFYSSYEPCGGSPSLLMDPSQYWLPQKDHKLVKVNEHVDEFGDELVCLKDKQFKDVYAAPLILLPRIPMAALDFNVQPLTSDLILFYEAYVVGMRDLGKPHPDISDFWEWSFDHYTLQHLELGERVVATLDDGQCIMGHIQNM
jgi:hypothetical protein